MEVADHFATGDDQDKTEQEMLTAALNATADEKLTGFALRLVLIDHNGVPQEGLPDPLAAAVAVFAPPKKLTRKAKAKPTLVPKKATAKRLKAA